MEENRVQPFQKYLSGNHLYHVENLLEVHFAETKGFHSSCKVSIQETENEDGTKNWQIEKTEDVPLPSENHFMEILHELEEKSYPISIKVDEKGSFLSAADHKKYVEEWKQKTASIQEKYQNAEIFRNFYLSALEDESTYYQNQFKEPFWNLLLFAPSYADNGGDSEESIRWNIKGIGNIDCRGNLTAEQREYGFDAFFRSESTAPEHIKEELNRKYLQRAEQYQAELTIQMEYNSPKKQYTKKKAEFILRNGDQIVYREISSMI
ncbi:hypothetical protein ACM46_19160 [Chryseobacterium angstadtii]|uniref:Uncharacterized protein n=1 Tax=Chryseobacterium angstadtii TaxID=558151 RepID=A0A0J7I0D9_9FLAO|nr:hypothetical protein [Chryseobacterium angstadtii]KMQ59256.1 hypothetical protein ACM46_19160 [Chryseobacterium angstadtii]